MKESIQSVGGAVFPKAKLECIKRLLERAQLLDAPHHCDCTAVIHASRPDAATKPHQVPRVSSLHFVRAPIPSARDGILLLCTESESSRNSNVRLLPFVLLSLKR
ncbi:hypothetical protein ACFX19_004722 [Malus domestica]